MSLYSYLYPKLAKMRCLSYVVSFIYLSTSFRSCLSSKKKKGGGLLKNQKTWQSTPQFRSVWLRTKGPPWENSSLHFWLWSCGGGNLYSFHLAHHTLWHVSLHQWQSFPVLPVSPLVVKKSQLLTSGLRPERDYATSVQHTSFKHATKGYSFKIMILGLLMLPPGLNIKMLE
jgi:hypothetical protein